VLIDQRVFLEEIGILMDWFNRDFEEATLKRLHQRLSQHLTTAEFLQAAITVFDSCRFFPTVSEFVSAVKGDPETQALHDWELCIKAAARNDLEMIAHLSAQGQSALHLVGGLYQLGMATEDELRWIKKEFVAVWKSTPAHTRGLLSSANMNLEQIESMQLPTQQLSVNGARR